MAPRPEDQALVCRTVAARFAPLPGIFFALELRQGATLGAEKRRLGADANPHLLIFVNGILCLDDARRVRAGDAIVWVSRPQGGLKKVLGLAALVAVAAASAGLGSFLAAPIAAGGLGWSAFAAGLAAGAAGMVGTLLVHALFPPPGQPAPEALPGARQLYSLTSIRNAANPYGPVPFVIGKHKIYPPLASLPYTEVIGNEQALHVVFGWLGRGKLEPNSLKIGDTPIADYDGVEAELRLADFVNAPTFNLVKRQVRQEVLNVDLSFEYGSTIPNDFSATAVTQPFHGWHQRTTAADCSGIGLEFFFPQGLGVFQEVRRSRDGPAALPRTVELEAHYRKSGTTTWKPLLWEDRTEAQSIAYDPTMNSRFRAPGFEGRAVSEFDYSGGDTRQPSTVTRRTLIVSNSKIGQQLRRAIYASLPAAQYEVRVRLRSSKSRAKRKILNIADKVYWTALKSYRADAPVADPNITTLEFKATASRQLSGGVNALNLVWQGSTDWGYRQSRDDWVTSENSNPASWYLEVAVGRLAPLRGRLAPADMDLPRFKNWYLLCAHHKWTVNRIVDQPTNLLSLLKDIAAAGRAAPAIRDGKHSIIVDQAQGAIVQFFTSANSSNYHGAIKYRDLPHGLKVQFLDEEKDWRQTQLIVYRDGYSAANATRFELLSLPGITNRNLIYRHARNYFEQAMLRPEEHVVEVDIDNLIAERGDRVRFSHEVNGTSFGVGRVKSYEAASRKLTFDRPVFMPANKNMRLQFFTGPGAEFSRSFPSVSVAAFHSEVILHKALSQAEAAKVVGATFAAGETSRFALDCVISRIEPLPNARARVAMVAYDNAMYDDEALPVPPWDPGSIQKQGFTGLAQPFPNLPPEPPPRNPEIVTVDEFGNIIRQRPGDNALDEWVNPGTQDPEAIRPPLPPASVEIESGLAVMLVADDVLVPRVQIIWRQDPRAHWDINDLRLVAEAKRSELSGAAWAEAGAAPASEGQLFLTGFVEGEFWDFRLFFRSVSKPFVSLFAQINLHQIVGRGGPPSAPSTLFINEKLLSWNHENQPLDVKFGGGYILKYHYGDNSNWETGIPLHNKWLKASPFNLDKFDNYHPYTFMLKSVDGAGNESEEFALLQHNFGERTDKDLVKRISFSIPAAIEIDANLAADAYPPLISLAAPDLESTLYYRNGQIVGNALLPQRSSSDFWTDDDAPFWDSPGEPVADPANPARWVAPGDNLPFWDTNHWLPLEVFFRVAIAASEVGDQLVLEQADFGGLEAADYRRHGDRPFWTDDTAPIWDSPGEPQIDPNDPTRWLSPGDNLPFWKEGDGDWTSLRGQQIGERLQEGLYEFRVRINEGETDSVPVAVTQMDVVLDGVDQVETHNDVLIPVNGIAVRLFNKYSRKQNVSYSMQDIGTDARRVLVVKHPQEVILTAYDDYGNSVRGSVDFSVRGY